MPLLFVLALVNAPVAGWFAIWGIDNVNHCNDLPAGQTCGLGFAVGIPLGWVATALLAGAVFGLGFVRSPKWVPWLGCASAVAAMWSVNVWALSLYQARAI